MSKKLYFFILLASGIMYGAEIPKKRTFHELSDEDKAAALAIGEEYHKDLFQFQQNLSSALLMSI